MRSYLFHHQATEDPARELDVPLAVTAFIALLSNRKLQDSRYVSIRLYHCPGTSYFATTFSESHARQRASENHDETPRTRLHETETKPKTAFVALDDTTWRHHLPEHTASAASGSLTRSSSAQSGSTRSSQKSRFCVALSRAGSIALVRGGKLHTHTQTHGEREQKRHKDVNVCAGAVFL